MGRAGAAFMTAALRAGGATRGAGARAGGAHIGARLGAGGGAGRAARIGGATRMAAARFAAAPLPGPARLAPRPRFGAMTSECAGRTRSNPTFCPIRILSECRYFSMRISVAAFVATELFSSLFFSLHHIPQCTMTSAQRQYRATARHALRATALSATARRRRQRATALSATRYVRLKLTMVSPATQNL